MYGLWYRDCMSDLRPLWYLLLYERRTSPDIVLYKRRYDLWFRVV